MSIIDLCERGLIPDALTRLGMRRMMADRLRQERIGGIEAQQQRFMTLLQSLVAGPLALSTELANDQHYEVAADFFELVLGHRLKYSCCYFNNEDDSLDEAEAAMLALTCERAEIKDGTDILELGCGWGSLTLWMAEHYPNANITTVSNSASQRQFIESRCEQRGFNHVRVVTVDMNEFNIDEEFDTVVSVEMFEHMRNYRLLLNRVDSWLKPNGRLFVHIFCHKTLMYPFVTRGEADWMAKYFFTDGLMPSQATLHYFQEDLSLVKEWRVDGRHYERTANGWLAKLDSQRGTVVAALKKVYGNEAEIWTNRWRMFFMACAELFGYNNGQEWWVSHYLFQKPKAK